jgi:hypothetical protein
VKVVQAKLGGTPTAGDLIQLYYTASRGGRSTAGYIVRPGDTLDDIGKGIVASAGMGNYIGEMDVKCKGTTITIICSNLVEDCTFFSEVVGSGTETFTVEEL